MRLYSNICPPGLTLAAASSFFADTSTFLLSRSSLLSLIFFLYLGYSQQTFSFSMAALRLVQISGFFTLGCPCSMNSVSLSYSSWISSRTLKNSALLGSMERSLNAFSNQIMPVLKSFNQVQIIPIIQQISATFEESQPYCYSRNFKARQSISRALESSPCNLYNMPILYRQSPANCPRMFALFLKHSMALRKYPSSAKQHPTRKQQLDASYESGPKKVMMILVQSTQYEMQSMPIAQLRFPMQEMRFSFFWRCQQYFSLTASFCLIEGTSLRSYSMVAFSFRYCYSSCLADFLSDRRRQVLVSRQTVPPQSSSYSASGDPCNLFLSSPTSTLASRRHSENCLWLKFSQQLFLTQKIFFWRSSAGPRAGWQLFLCPFRQCQNWWSREQQKAFSHSLHWKRASFPQIQHPGAGPFITFSNIQSPPLQTERGMKEHENNAGVDGMMMSRVEEPRQQTIQEEFSGWMAYVE